MDKKLKILNLYCGIGGNRKLWSNDHDITAVEINPEIAKIYQDFFPNDKVVVGDAHEYLLEHFREFDFIWSSPPCPSHSKLRLSRPNEIIFPDITLYQEILLLQNWAKCKWIIENVEPYYTPLIAPLFQFDRHCFWANFIIAPYFTETKWRTCKVDQEREFLQEQFGFNLDNYKGIDKRKALRNCVVPELGKHIFDCAFSGQVQTLFDVPSMEQQGLFAEV